MIFFIQAGFRRCALVLIAAALLATPLRANAADYPWLTGEQMAQLRALPIPVLLPAYVPPGYRLVKFEAVRDIVRNGQHSAPANEYLFRFRGPSGEFTISVADGGFGDSEPDYSSFRRPFTVDSPVVGRAKFEPDNINGVWTWVALFIPLKRLGSDKAQLIVTGSDKSDIARVYASLKPLAR
ncbi:MAG TPA: hypothetical protein VGX96_12280 [Candidatus Elarobacter sp.]|jgi:hypothetical protein|nr:hypothetical protein [Candidatus Elarobacter sp.]